MTRVAIALCAVLTACGGMVAGEDAEPGQPVPGDGARPSASPGEPSRPIAPDDGAPAPAAPTAAPSVSAPTPNRSVPGVAGCPPAAMPPGSSEVIPSSTTPSRLSGALAATPHGFVVQFAQYYGRGGSCQQLWFLPTNGDPWLAIDDANCGFAFAAHGRWAWGVTYSGLHAVDLSQIADGDVGFGATYDLGGSRISALAAGPDGVVFGDPLTNRLYHSPSGLEPPRQIGGMEATEPLAALALRDGQVYGLQASTDPSLRLWRRGLGGGREIDLERFDDAYLGATRIAVGGGRVYVPLIREATLELVRLDASTGAREASHELGDRFSSVSADDEHVYWVGGEERTIWRTSHCAFEPVVVATGDIFGDVALDDQYVYWSTGTELVRRPK